MVMVFGEITTKAKINYEQVVRDTLKRIGYDDNKKGIVMCVCVCVCVCLGRVRVRVSFNVLSEKAHKPTRERRTTCHLGSRICL